MAKQVHQFKAPAVKQPTPEELEAQAKRAFLQKRNSIAEGILFNAIQAWSASWAVDGGKPDFKPAVEAAIEAADHYMAKVYSVAITQE